MPKKLDPKVAEKVMLKAGLKPLEPYKNSGARWKCKCLKCGKVVTPIYSGIKQGQGGCKFCGYLANKMKQIKPEQSATKIMLKVGLKPLEPYKGIRTPWKCKCLKCKKIIYPTLGNISNGSKCGYCQNKIVDPEDALKVMLKAKLKPLEPYKSSAYPWKCKCLKCGRVVKPSFASIGQGQGGCQYCAKNKVDPREAIKVMIKAKLKPLEPYKGSKTKWKCKCLKCKKIVYPNLKGVKVGEGCANCAIGGINPISPAYMYLITNFGFNAHKVGIANTQTIRHRDRLYQFKAKGWKAHKVWQFKTGLEALSVETEVFRMLRKEMRLPQYLSQNEMAITGGWSETVSADEITLLELEKIIKKVIKGYKNADRRT